MVRLVGDAWYPDEGLELDIPLDRPLGHLLDDIEDVLYVDMEEYAIWSIEETEDFATVADLDTIVKLKRLCLELSLNNQGLYHSNCVLFFTKEAHSPIRELPMAKNKNKKVKPEVAAAVEPSEPETVAPAEVKPEEPVKEEPPVVSEEPKKTGCCGSKKKEEVVEEEPKKAGGCCGSKKKEETEIVEEPKKSGGCCGSKKKEEVEPVVEEPKKAGGCCGSKKKVEVEEPKKAGGCCGSKKKVEEEPKDGCGPESSCCAPKDKEETIDVSVEHAWKKKPENLKNLTANSESGCAFCSSGCSVM